MVSSIVRDENGRTRLGAIDVVDFVNVVDGGRGRNDSSTLVVCCCEAEIVRKMNTVYVRRI